MNSPLMIVSAGPSGSGKSTSFPVSELGLPWFNVDHWCAQLVGGYPMITPKVRSLGGQACEEFVADHIKMKRSFAVETTLRGQHAIEQAKQAKQSGFITVMNYVSVNSIEIAFERVRLRSLSGGHGAPLSIIREIGRCC